MEKPTGFSALLFSEIFLWSIVPSSFSKTFLAEKKRFAKLDLFLGLLTLTLSVK